MALLEQEFKALTDDIQYVKYKKDRHFTYEGTATDFLSGIFITGSNIDKQLTDAFPVDFSHLTDEFYQSMTDALNAGFPSRQYTKKQATEHFQALQRINILNVEVLRAISEIFKVEFLLDRLETSRSGTGILHYVDLNLSDLFNYFKKVGIKMVFGIDEGCRITHANRAAIRAAEEAEGVTPRKPGPGFPGGTSFRKKSKRKGQSFKQMRKGSRRFHKKS
jgi:hypothetical protein